MATTTVELFRAGNSSSARLDILRPGEVVVFQQYGIGWVKGRSGGASTFDAPVGLRGKWWLLPNGTTYDDRLLVLWNDYGNHWSWEPVQDMSLDAYLEALRDVNRKFVAT
jgi:hypothetical protein